MIAIAVILLLSAALIAGLAMFWQNILAWIKKAVTKIKEVLGLQPDGTRTFITRTIEGLKNKSKYYYKNQLTSEWEEVVYTKSIDENEVPLEYQLRAKVSQLRIDEEISTTEELKCVINA